MNARLATHATPIAGLMLIERRPVGDERGRLERLFCAEELGPLLAGRSIAQVNLTHTARVGTVRGMHFQHPPHAEMKIVNCVRGEVFDVAVDLRKGSPTFLRWHAEVLRPDNCKALLIPEGFAHGFQTLRDDTEVGYLISAFYAPEAAAGVRYDDPAFAIDWPLPVISVSEKDRAWPDFAEHAHRAA